MTDRRTFLKAAGAGLAAIAASPALAAARAPFRYHRVAVDARSAESLAFGRAAALAGQAVTMVERGDVTGFWYDELHRQWRIAPQAIAGMTGREPFFCLDLLARDQALRTVMTVEHRIEADHAVHHASAPASMMAGIEAAIRRDDWAAGMAEAALRPGAPHEPRIQRMWRTPAAAHARPQTLISWIIAPLRA